MIDLGATLQDLFRHRSVNAGAAHSSIPLNNLGLCADNDWFELGPLAFAVDRLP